MNKQENNFISMLYGLKTTCDAHASVWSGDAGFSAAYNSGVVAILSAIPGILAAQLKSPKAASVPKKAARKALEAALVFMSGRIVLYAKIIADDTLEEDAYLPPYIAQAAKDDALVGMATRMCGIATDHLTPLGPYGVDAALVADLGAKGAAYAALIGTPAHVRQSRKEATAALKAALATARRELDIMDAHLVLWRESAPAFCSVYETSRRVGKPGFRTRALEVVVKNAEGKPVAGAAFLLLAAKVKRKTSAKGQCRVAHLPDGAYTAQLSAPGYGARAVAFYVTAGETTKLAIVLEAPQL